MSLPNLGAAKGRLDDALMLLDNSHAADLENARYSIHEAIAAIDRHIEKFGDPWLGTAPEKNFTHG